MPSDSMSDFNGDAGSIAKTAKNGGISLLTIVAGTLTKNRHIPHEVPGDTGRVRKFPARAAGAFIFIRIERQLKSSATQSDAGSHLCDSFFVNFLLADKFSLAVH